MYKEFELQTQKGKKKFGFLASGTTAYRYRQVFHQDLMICLNKMEESQNDQTDMSVGDKLAFIMNCQAEGKELKKQNFDTFLEWCDQFDGAELFMHMQDFVSLYIGSRATTSVPKKAVARPTGK